MNLYKILNSKVSWSLSIAILIAVICVVIWSLDKGMIFSDEAFFVFSTIPGVEVLGMTYWHILYSPFILDNYIYTKCLLVFLAGSSAYLMGYSAASYLKFSLSPVLIGIWCVITQFALFSPTGITPNHTTINLIIFNCLITSLSFFLLYKKNIFLLLVGVFFASLTFVMITNNIFIIPLLLFLFLNDKKGFWKQIIWAGLGCLTLFSIYFIFLQSPQEFISGILKAIEALNYDKNHGSSGLIIWHKKLLMEILIPLILIAIAYTKFSRVPWIRYTLIIGSTFFLLYTIYNGITNKYTLFPLLSFYFIVGFIIIYTPRRNITIKTFFAILLIILPYFASFGTDVSFFIKAIFYFPFILVGSLYLGFQLDSKKGNLLIIGFLVTLTIATLTFFSYPFRLSWDGYYKLIEQDQAFEFKGGTFFFDSERFHNLKEAYPYLHEQENVLVSDPRLWGYVLLSDARPPYQYFEFSEYTLKYIEENEIPKKSLLLLEDREKPFKDETIQKLVGDKFIIKKVQLSHFNIYTLEDSNL